MKKISFVLLFLMTFFSCQKDMEKIESLGGEILTQTSSVNSTMNTQKKFEPNQILVKFKDGRPDDLLLRQQKSVIKEKIHTAAMKYFNYSGLHLLMVPDISQALESFKRNPNVEWVTPNYTVSHGAYTPNDSYYPSSLWGLSNIKAPTAWNTNIGDQKVYIGVIDEGIQYFHEDLCGQIWTNPYETENGIDDDGNGYIDDIHGWDFLNKDKTIYDFKDNHGTHVAGTIGGIGNNGKGVVGVSPNVTMISGKFLEGSGSISDAIKAVDYMTDLKIRHGLNIAATSNSWGGGGYVQGMYDAINRAKAQNILFVAAAGNDGLNSDINFNYPSGYNLDNIISVAAYNSSETLPSWTNYGATTVDIGAPGVSIISTVAGSTYNSYSYSSYSGTSMATPHVSGAVALYKAGNPNATYSEVRNAILSKARPIPSLSGKCVTGGALNIESFITPTTNSQTQRSCVVPQEDLTPPTVPTNLREVSRTAGAALIAWNASTDNVGVANYVILVPYSWYVLQTTVSASTLQYNLTGLTDGVTYPISVYAVDGWGNQSPQAKLTVSFGNDTIPPTTPQNLKVVSVKPTEISLAYDWSTDDWSGIGMYRLSYKVASCNNCTWSYWHTNGVNPMTVPGLTTGSQYAFTIAAMDNNKNWSPESTPVVLETPRDVTDNIAPTQSVLSVTSKTSNSVSLSWTVSTDNVGMSGYRIYRSISGQNSWSLLSTQQSTTYTSSGLQPNTTYDFYIESFDAMNNKTSSNVVTQKTDQQIYTISTSLTGSISKKTTHALKWTTTISPSGFTLTSVEVQVQVNSVWQTIYTQPTPSLSGSYNRTVTSKTPNVYRVVTKISTGQVSNSNSITLTTR